jgi:hypothetical protein
MTNFFIDTSAFVKYFTIEKGSEIVIDIIDDTSN